MDDDNDDEKKVMMHFYEFDVSGMSCDRCAMWVTEAIEKNVERVVNVRVNSVKKDAKRNVVVSVLMSPEEEEEKTTVVVVVKKNIVRALELAGYGCVESNNKSTTTTTNLNDDDAEDERDGEREKKIQFSRVTLFLPSAEKKHARANKRLPAPPPLRDKELQRERSRARQQNLSPTNFKVTSSSRFRF